MLTTSSLTSNIIFGTKVKMNTSTSSTEEDEEDEDEQDNQDAEDDQDDEGDENNRDAESWFYKKAILSVRPSKGG